MELSKEEQAAGISRRALESLKNAGNGNGRQSTNEVISAYRATPVIDTPMRAFHVLESVSGHVILRYTEWGQRGAAVVQIPLSYAECHSLSVALDRLEGDEKPIVEATKGKAITTTRMRAI